MNTVHKCSILTHRGPNFVPEPEHSVSGSADPRVIRPGQVGLSRLLHPHNGEPVLDGKAGGGDRVSGEAGLPVPALQCAVQANQDSEQKNQSVCHQAFALLSRSTCHALVLQSRYRPVGQGTGEPAQPVRSSRNQVRAWPWIAARGPRLTRCQSKTVAWLEDIFSYLLCSFYYIEVPSLPFFILKFSPFL